MSFHIVHVQDREFGHGFVTIYEPYAQSAETKCVLGTACTCMFISAVLNTISYWKCTLEDTVKVA
jgi:hypothetical protein